MSSPFLNWNLTDHQIQDMVQQSFRIQQPNVTGSGTLNYCDPTGTQISIADTPQYFSVKLQSETRDSNSYYIVDVLNAWNIACIMRLESDADLYLDQTIWAKFVGMTTSSPNPVDDGFNLLQPISIGSIGNSGFTGEQNVLTNFLCDAGILKFTSVIMTYKDGLLLAISDPILEASCTICDCGEPPACEYGPDVLDIDIYFGEVYIGTCTLTYDGVDNRYETRFVDDTNIICITEEYEIRSNVAVACVEGSWEVSMNFQQEIFGVGTTVIWASTVFVLTSFTIDPYAIVGTVTGGGDGSGTICDIPLGYYNDLTIIIHEPL